MPNRLTKTRLILAVISTALEETAIWVIWRWLLPVFGINLPVAVLIVAMVVWELSASGSLSLPPAPCKNRSGRPAFDGRCGGQNDTVSPRRYVG